MPLPDIFEYPDDDDTEEEEEKLLWKPTARDRKLTDMYGGFDDREEC